MEEIIDRRPDPKPRKHPHLWQSYLWWDELMQMQKRHTLRRIAAERGKSNLDAQFEADMTEQMALDALVKTAAKTMASYGRAVGPVWDWLTGIRGIGDHTAAKLLALIDDPAKFATVSKLWRFSGYGLKDGQIDRPTKGAVLPYNRRLKSELFLVAENFVKQQTPVYVTIYYEEKERQRHSHPEPVCGKCGTVATQRALSWVCPECRASGRAIVFTPAHVHYRACRKVIKILLQHLWVVWREAEGLPVTMPYVHDVLHHTHYIAPVSA
jgi:ribosomal protein L37AE/L43A